MREGVLQYLEGGLRSPLCVFKIMSIKPEIQMYLVVVEPPEGVTLAMQRGKDELLEPSEVTADALVFAFTLVVADLEAAPVRFTGEFAQGPASARFVYVNSGTLAGQPDSVWTRRAKVPLTGISAELVKTALESGRPLVAEVAGTGRGGGPLVASIPLLRNWELGV
jgi:Family of unknown function (DUF5990)